MSFDRPLTVAELSELLKDLVEGAFPTLSVIGEVTNFVTYRSSGHSYFDLVDTNRYGQKCVLHCVAFRGTKVAARLAQDPPKEGHRVVVTGRVTTFAGRSQYQLRVEDIAYHSLGDLLRRLEELKRRLAAEGLFDESRKRPLPRVPQCVGIVTSRQGAALRDMLRYIYERFPARVVIAPSLVQGEGAAEQMAARIEALNLLGEVDVIVLGRGGGSLEDLWAFNEEVLVRAVAASGVPVVSAVGHETDFVLTDFAADVRAATPTAAANLVVPRIADLRRELGDLQSRLFDAMERRWMVASQNLDHLEARLVHQHGMFLEKTKNRLEVLGARLEARSPLRSLKEMGRLLAEKEKALEKAAESLVQSRRQTLDRLALGLRHLDPYAPVGRGYALVFAPGRRLLKLYDEVRLGERIEVLLKRGGLGATVTDSSEDAFGLAPHALGGQD